MSILSSQSMGLQMYKAAVQQEEQHTPAFVRLQQQADAKEEEAQAEKKRRWEEQVASKKFWVSCHIDVCVCLQCVYACE